MKGKIDRQSMGTFWVKNEALNWAREGSLRTLLKKHRYARPHAKRTQQHRPILAVSDFRFFSFRSGFFFFSFPFHFFFLLYYSEYVLRLKEYRKKERDFCAWGEKSFAFTSQKGPVCGCVELRGMVEVKEPSLSIFLHSVMLSLSLTHSFFFFGTTCVFSFVSCLLPFFMLKQSFFNARFRFNFTLISIFEEFLINFEGINGFSIFKII